jgi:S1-C subfamily serine protease
MDRKPNSFGGGDSVKKTCLLASVALSLFCGTSAAERAVQQRPCVVRIQAGQNVGSGVIVADDRVVTCWHVTRIERDKVTVWFHDGSSANGLVVADSDPWDVAVIEVRCPPGTAASITRRRPRLGERLTVAGFGPPPFRYREASGPVVQFMSPTGGHPEDIVEFRATARLGDSGGPVFNSDGEVTAVVFGCTDGLSAGSLGPRVLEVLEAAK